ncbi:2-hydroxyacid dehydrogenase [Roseomonas sp. SSH11]|uniref:2-hydroxyacid dehydrogenase n=1 Tax=Pararoseomonas baculiformis TaxID=2820812 RepID=A0ABS4AGB0_9PROT|nr:2-hydroxyacid dehydrogenase [Pararoseomonas baculiformis]MBP0446041.1 2-hydroxyacid dehydrogenase [Pararoseomonas baculiformis]
MKVAVFSAKRYDRQMLAELNGPHGHALTFQEARLEPETVALASGFPAVSVFVNDQVDAGVLEALAAGGTRLVATRSTGFNQIDLRAAARLGIRVTRVADYSPHSVAEFAVGLLLALNRRIHKAFERTRSGNFELDGLMGFDLHGRTVGVIGTGKIGRVFARIMAGFGCRVLGHDPFPHPGFEALGGRYVEREVLARESDVISLHCPLTEDTRHVVNAAFLASTRPGLLLVNTSRGGLVDTRAVIAALKSRRLGGLAIDVYEQEASLFFQDRSSDIIDDDLIQRLVSFPNVLLTGHQAFFTREAFGTICATTLESITAFERGEELANEVRAPG